MTFLTAMAVLLFRQWSDYRNHQAKLDMKIESLDLSLRARNCLEYGYIKTVRELIQLDEDELMSIRNVGETTLVEIRQQLLLLDLHLGMDENGRSPKAKTQTNKL